MELGQQGFPVAGFHVFFFELQNLFVLEVVGASGFVDFGLHALIGVVGLELGGGFVEQGLGFVLDFHYLGLGDCGDQCLPDVLVRCPDGLQMLPDLSQEFDVLFQVLQFLGVAWGKA